MDASLGPQRLAEIGFDALHSSSFIHKVAKRH